MSNFLRRRADDLKLRVASVERKSRAFSWRLQRMTGFYGQKGNRHKSGKGQCERALVENPEASVVIVADRESRP